MDRGQRRHDERRVYARRQRRTPGYVARYPGKTPGRLCSCWLCSGRWRGALPRDLRRLQDDLAALVAEAPSQDERAAYAALDACPVCSAGGCCDEVLTSRRPPHETKAGL